MLIGTDESACSGLREALGALSRNSGPSSWGRSLIQTQKETGGVERDRTVEQAAPAQAADALDARVEDIAYDWVERATRAIYAGHPEIDRRAIIDHAPEMIHGVAEALRRGEPEELEAPWGEPAREHALVRRQQGMVLGDLVREYQLLRVAIWRVLRPFLATIAAQDASEVAESLNSALDTMATISTSTYGAELQHALERTRRLQAVTAALVPAVNVDDVTLVIIGQAMGTLRALGGLLSLVNEDGKALELRDEIGLIPDLVEQSRRVTMDSLHPLAVAARTGEPVWIESPPKRARWHCSERSSMRPRSGLESRLKRAERPQRALPPSSSRPKTPLWRWRWTVPSSTGTPARSGSTATRLMTWSAESSPPSCCPKTQTKWPN